MKLETITEKNFDEYYSLLEQDFCYEERKSKKDEFETLKNKLFHPNFIYHNDEKVGYISFWDFDEFVYIEHFAILSEKRNMGYGKNFLSEFVRSCNKNIIFEVELPNDEITIRRVKFHKNIGFIINEYDYHQPSYHNGDDAIAMKIMSLKPLKKDEYFAFVDKIKKYCYGRRK